MSKTIIEVRDLCVGVAGRALLNGVNLRVQEGRVFGIIGPSGAGKSTLLRCMNRLSELIPGVDVDGEVFLCGESVAAMDVNRLRVRVGMLFQQPVVFPGSVRENIVFAAKRLRRMSRAEQAEIVEVALRKSALWEEVRDRLDAVAGTLSVGQQQRLCLARALAVEPEVILMDEPTSALDPRSTAAIEELIFGLKEKHSIVLVTHNLSQARRVADEVAYLGMGDGGGRIMEQGEAGEVFSNPRSEELAAYLQQLDCVI